MNRFGHAILSPLSPGAYSKWPETFRERVWEQPDKTNNGGSSNPTDVTFAEPDLRVIEQSLVIPASAASGGFVPISFRVENQGERATRVSSWFDRVYISRDGSLDTYDELIGTFRHTDVVPVGGGYDVTGEVRLPDNIDGPFHILVYIDSPFGPPSPFAGMPLPYPIEMGPARIAASGNPMGQVHEFHREDNDILVRPINVSFVDQPDLQVTRIASSDRVLVGETFDVTYEVTNTGGGPVPDRQTPWTDHLYLSRDQFLDVRTDHFLGLVEHIGVLGAGESYEVTRTLRLPRGILGPYYVFVLTDVPRGDRPRGVVLEESSANNASSDDVPMLIELPPPADLQVDTISLPDSPMPGDTVTIQWAVSNHGTVAASGIWADSVYLSRDAVWDLGDRLLGTVEPERSRTLLPNEGYTETLTAQIPSVLPDSYRVIVRTDIFDDINEGNRNANNTTASADTLDVVVPTLQLGVPVLDMLAADGDLLYQVAVPAGETLELRVDAENDAAATEVYIRFDALPSTLAFDAAFEGHLFADQRVLIPRTEAGNYYIRVRGSQSSISTPVRLLARLLPFAITDVSPDHGGDAQYVTMTLRGAKFSPAATVKLVRPQFGEFAPVNYQIVNATKIIATFDFTIAPPTGLAATQPLFVQAKLGVLARQSLQRPSSFDAIIEPFTAEGFARQVRGSGADIGPLGIAFHPDGERIFVSGGAGRNEIYEFGRAGGVANVPIGVLDVPIYDMSFDSLGQFWATTGGQGLVLLDPDTGAVLDRFSTGVTLGMAGDPNASTLYLATSSGVQTFDTITRRFRPFSSTRVDGLAVAPDGTLWGTRWPEGGEIVRFDSRGRAEVVLGVVDELEAFGLGGGGRSSQQAGRLHHKAESIAFGLPGTVLDGLMFVSHATGGRLTMVDVRSLETLTIATGGGRGDFLHVGPDGRLYLSETDQVDVFFPITAPHIVATTPVNRGGVVPIVNRATVTFDVAMYRGGESDPKSVTNPANFRLLNRTSGEPIDISQVIYDESSRSAELVFESLQPESYQLEVMASVTSELGVPLGQDFTSDFFVLEDLSADIQPEFSTTRLDRATGTVSFDVKVTNPLNFNLGGPVRVVFTGLTDPTVSLVEADGVDDDGHPYLQLLAAGAGELAPGQSLSRTVTVFDPNALRLDLGPRVLAGLPANLVPQFESSPVQSVRAGQSYSYAAQAVDPDGVGVTYALVKAPPGATVDPESGAVDWMPTATDSPEAPFELRAYDARGGFTRQLWMVDVADVNMPPVLAPIADQTVRESDLLEIQAGAFDADGDPLVFWADNLPPGATFDAATNILRWRPNGLAAGRYSNVQIFASDGLAESFVSFEVVVTNRNQPPVLDQPPDRSIREGDSLAIALHTTDVDGDAIRFSSPNLPPGAFVHPITGIFTWTPRFDQHGDFDIDVTASDGQARTTRTMHIDVTNVNGVVEFPRIDRFEIFEGQPLMVRVAANDPEVPGLVTSPLVVNEDFFIDAGGLPQLTYDHTPLPSGATFDLARQVFTWIPSFTQAGNYVISFIATDDGDGTGTATSDSVDLEIVVMNLNGVPVVDAIDNREITVGATIDVPVRATDPDGEALAVSVVGLPVFATFTDNGDGTGTIHAATQPGDRGDYVIFVRATDSGGGNLADVQTGEAVFILSVESDNEPPVLESIGGKVAIIGEEIVFQVRVADADQDALTFSATGLPAGATFAATNIYGIAEFRWTPQAADAGTIAITFTVEDSGNGVAANKQSDTESIQIVVRSTNTAPQLQPIGTQSVTEGQLLTITLDANDPDGDPLTYRAANLPFGATFDTATRTFAWTPNFAQAGTRRVRFDVTDGNRTRGEDVTINVANANQPPVFVPLPVLLAQEGLPIGFTVAGGDPDGDGITFFIDSDLPPGASFDPDNQFFLWTPGFDQAGMRTVRFGVRDTGGLVDTFDAMFQVINVNRPPTIPPLSGRVARIGEPFELAIPASDPDAGTTLRYSATMLPAGATLDSVTGVLRWTPLGVQAGEHHIQIRVSDGELAARRQLTLVATSESLAPDVRIELTPSFAVAVGQSVLVQAVAAGIADIASLQVTIDGVPQTLDQFGRVRFTTTAPGRVEVTATATDIDGGLATAAAVIKVRDLTDRAPPVVNITLPPDGAVITEPTDVIGSVADTNLDEFRVELVAFGNTERFLLRSGTAPVAGGMLGRIDPNRLENGFYTLELTATDIGGRTGTVSRLVEVNTATKAAAFADESMDLTAMLDGVPITITRRYSSLSANVAGTFGLGWQFAGAEPRIETNVMPTGQEDSGVFNPFALDTRAYVNLPDGRRVAFTFTPTRQDLAGVTIYQPAWTPDVGVDFQLASVDARLQLAGGKFYQLGTGLAYNPGSSAFDGFDYTLTGPDGTQYRYDMTAGLNPEVRPDGALREIVAPGGERIVWTSNAVIAPSGARITFERDAVGRITSVTGPDGHVVHYQYDASGRLAQVRDFTNDQREQFGYHDGTTTTLVTEIIRSVGPSQAIAYDAAGSLVATLPIHGHLGTTRELLSSTPSDSLAADATRRHSFVMGERELTTAANREITLGVEVIGRNGLDPAAPMIRGVPAGFTRVEAGRSLGLFTIRTGGPYVIEISGVDGLTAGDFDLDIFLAGDINADAAIDGTDTALFAAAFGSTTGQPAYVVAADADRDDDVDLLDREFLDRSFAFIANRAPTASDGQSQTREGIPIEIRLAGLAADADGDVLDFGIRDLVGGTISLSGDAGSILFTPALGFTGAASFRFAADDSLESSALATVSIQVDPANFVHLNLSRRDLVLDAGDLVQLAVTGEFADGAIEAIPTAQIQFVSTNSAVATITSDGSIVAHQLGVTIIEVHAYGLVAATPVTIGQPDDRFLEFFPLSYAMPPGRDRQFLVRERVPQTVLDLSAAVNGARYFVENPAIGAITPDGLFTSLALGETSVTIVTGGRSVVVPVMVEQPAAGQVMIGADGGLVSDGAGITVGIPQGAFDEEINFSVRSVTAAELPYSLPTGWNFAGGFDIDWNDLRGEHPFSIEMPAPAGSQPGDPMFVFQPVTAYLDGGQSELTWMLIDSMRVGTDGMMRTTSPPNIGVGGRSWEGSFTTNLNPSAAGFGAVASGSVIGLLFALQDLGTRQKHLQSQYGEVISADVAPGGGDGETRFYVAAGPLGDILVPAIADFPYKLKIQTSAPTGLRTIAETEVQIGAGEIVEKALPQAPRILVRADRIIQPVIVRARVEVGDADNPAPRMILTGRAFTMVNPNLGAPSNLGQNIEDLIVHVDIGADDKFDDQGNIVQVGGRDYTVPGSELSFGETVTENGVDFFELIVPIPANALLGPAIVRVTRPMQVPLNGQYARQEFTSNPVQILPAGRLAMVADGAQNLVSVIDLTKRESNAFVTKLKPEEVARIPLGVGLDLDTRLGPRKTVFNKRGTLAYVTLLTGGGVSVIDAVALHEVDINRDTPGVQHIELPAGARPNDLVADSQDRFLYVTDFEAASVYVIGIDPKSNDYHKLVRTIPVGDGSDEFTPLGLRGVAVSKDGKRLYVTAPGSDLFGIRYSDHGSIFTIDLQNPDAEFDDSVPGAMVAVGPHPVEITITDDPNVLLFVDRVSDTRGFGTLRRVARQDSEFYEVDYIDLTPFGLIPRLNEGRGTQAFGVSNPQGVIYIPKNSLGYVTATDANGRTTTELQYPHEAYAFITGFNKLSTGDPKHDPALAPFFTYNPSSGVFPQYLADYVPVGAGGNVGVIRNPLGDFESILDKPRLVAATRPVLGGFPDDLAVSELTNLLVVPFQALGRVFAYDALQMVLEVEGVLEQPAAARWGQFPEDPGAEFFPYLLRGPLSTIPIDDINQSIGVAADFRFEPITIDVPFRVVYELGPDGSAVRAIRVPAHTEVIGYNYGVPDVGPSGEEPNASAPVVVGDLPRGIAVQPKFDGVAPILVDTPLNPVPAREKLEVPAGTGSTVEVHSGEYHVQHDLVTYKSQQVTRGLQLHYDSLRAEPQPIFYFNIANLQSLDSTQQYSFVAHLKATLPGLLSDLTVEAMGISAERAQEVGLDEGDLVVPVPMLPAAGKTYGMGIQMDFSSCESGVYDFELEPGIFRRDTDGRLKGDVFLPSTKPIPVINQTDGLFGAGWGLNGYYEIIEGNGVVTMVNGDGSEETFTVPEVFGEAFTPTSGSRTLLKQLDDGRYIWIWSDGTVHLFNQQNKLEFIIGKTPVNATLDRNSTDPASFLNTINQASGGVTRFEYEDGQLKRVIDPVGFATEFFYDGDHVSRIVDPAGRPTTFEYFDNKLSAIIDPVGSRRTFDYTDTRHPDLITGQTFKRRYDINEPLPAPFQETVSYDEFGRIQGGVRMDGKSFTLNPAQVKAVTRVSVKSECGQTEEPPEFDFAALFEAFSRALEAIGDLGDPNNVDAVYGGFNGETVNFKVNRFGEFVQSSDAENATVTIERRDDGVIQCTTDEVGNKKCYTYDEFNNVTSITDYPDGPGSTRAVTETVRYDPDKFFQIIEKIDGVGRITTYTVDDAGLVTHATVTDPLARPGQVTTTTQHIDYTDAGLPDLTRDARGNVTDYVYDGRGRLTSLIFINGANPAETHTVTYVYVGPNGSTDNTCAPYRIFASFSCLSGRVMSLLETLSKPWVTRAR